ncbi:DUF4888 domain-containing protein [Azotobacter chroococcum]
MLTFEADVDPNLKFTLKNGNTVVTEVLSALSTTAGGDPITLVRINDTTIFGYADRGGANERVAFALVLEKIAPTVGDPGGARVTIVQYEAIEHPDNGSFDEAVDLTGLVFVDAVQDVAFDDFSTAAAGQNLWNSVTDTATGIQLLFTGLDFGSDTVNTSDFAIGSNSQSIAIGDGIVVDFVKNQTPAKDTDAKTVTTINFTERVEGPSGSFTLVQTGGNDANRVGAEIFAFDSSELGTDYTDGAIGEASPSQTIVSVKVWLGDTLVSAWDRTNGITNNTDPGLLTPSVTPTITMTAWSSRVCWCTIASSSTSASSTATTLASSIASACRTSAPAARPTTPSTSATSASAARWASRPISAAISTSRTTGRGRP